MALADNNYDLTTPALALTAAAAGTYNGTPQLNPNGHTVVLGINTTVDSAGSYVVNLQAQDVASGVWYTIGSTAAIVSAVFQTLTVGSGLAAVANVSVIFPLPRTWRVQAVVTTGPISATVGACVLI